MHPNSAQGLSSSSLASRSEFPPLPTVERSPRNLCPTLSNTNAVASTSSTGEEQIVTEEVSSFNMFQNPVHLLVFLAEVIQQTIVAKDRNEAIDVFKIITGAAGGRIGLPLDAEQIKIFAK